MRTIRLAILAVLLLFAASAAQAQLNIGGEPYSFKNHLSLSETPTAVLPPLDRQQIDREDDMAAQEGKPDRFGYKHPLALNLDRSGHWTELPNGDAIWTQKIQCPGGLSMNLLFDHFWLPTGSSLYIYDSKGSQLIGGFTARNNKGKSPEEKRGFGTTLLYTDEIVLEYYEPAAVRKQGILDLSYVVQGYRMIPGYDSGDGNYDDPLNYCMVNVNCSPEGDDAQDHKKGVALILVDGNVLCTGSLIANTSGDCTPLFLTAAHCGFSLSGDPSPGDYLDNYSFLWEYENEKCPNASKSPSLMCTNGATLLARRGIFFSTGTDFALLELEEDPLEAGIDVFYNGWSRTESPIAGGHALHHPRGDAKKVSTYSIDPMSEAFCATSGTNDKSDYVWGVEFDATPNGHAVVYGGSSGSPLFNDGKIIGQLFGPMYCDYPQDRCAIPDEIQVVYGRLSKSWYWNGGNFGVLQIGSFLDPEGLDSQSLEGYYPSCPCLQIELTAGWNMISSNCIPYNKSMEAVFSQIESDVIQVRDLYNAYIPAFDFNGIGDWDVRSGYMVNMLNPATLKIHGEHVSQCASEYHIDLQEGWNLIGYYPQLTYAPSTIFSGITNSVIQVKNLNGTYIPAINFNGIGYMVPGGGYQVKMLNPETLSYCLYPALTKPTFTLSYPGPRSSDQLDLVKHQPSENCATLLIDDTPAKLLQKGDRLIVLDSEGIQMNSFDHKEGTFGGLIYGPEADNKEASADWQSEYHIQVIREQTGQTFKADFKVLKGQRDFVKDDLAYVEIASLQELKYRKAIEQIPGDVSIQVVPNPSPELALLRLQMDQAKEFNIYLTDLSGRRIKTLFENHEVPSGNSKLSLNLQGIPAGSYFLVAESTEHKLARRLIKL